MAEKDLMTLGARLVCCAALLLACDDTDRGTVATRADGQCEAPEACDIEDGACQQSVLEATACMREDDVPDMPPVRVITKQKFRDELTAQAEKAGITVTPWDTALVAIGLSDPGMSSVEASIDETVNSLAAYYSDETKAVTVIRDATATDEATRMLVLSHELTHYLQDRESDLAMLSDAFGTTTDNHVALLAVVEGDAVVNSSRVSALLSGRDLDNLDWTGYFDQMLDAVLGDIEDSPSRLFTAQQSLAYPIGGRHVARVWDVGTRDDVDALFEPPQHPDFADWIAAYEAGELGPPAELGEMLDCAPPLPAQDFEVYGVDSLGAAGVIALLSNSAASPEQRLSLAAALRADAIAVYATSSAMDAPITPVRVAWRLRFSDVASAASFAAFADDAHPGDAMIHVFGDELLITGSDTAAAAFSDTAIAACPSFDELIPPGEAGTMHAIPRAALPGH